MTEQPMDCERNLLSHPSFPSLVSSWPSEAIVQGSIIGVLAMAQVAPMTLSLQGFYQSI